MAQFGWAYVNCGDVTGSSGGQAAGPTGSLQFLTGANATSGSAKLVFYTSSFGTYSANTLLLSGTLVVQGVLTASTFVVNQTDTISGSTIFGNSSDDTHQITGSLSVGAGAPNESVFQVDVSNDQSVTLGLRVNYRTVSSAGTSSTSDYIIGIGGGDGDIEYRIHSASDAGSGSIIVIKDENTARTGSISISASSGDTIDGESFYKLSGSAPAINLYSNGSDWFVF